VTLGLLNLVVELLRRNPDERRREIRQQGLEADAFLQFRL
jgi:hypothetical protein